MLKIDHHSRDLVFMKNPRKFRRGDDIDSNYTAEHIPKVKTNLFHGSVHGLLIDEIGGANSSQGPSHGLIIDYFSGIMFKGQFRVCP